MMEEQHGDNDDARSFEDDDGHSRLMKKGVRTLCTKPYSMPEAAAMSGHPDCPFGGGGGGELALLCIRCHLTCLQLETCLGMQQHMHHLRYPLAQLTQRECCW